MAVANAFATDGEFSPAAAVGTTVTAEPSAVPPTENVTVPVGPTPVLCVAMVAVSVTAVLLVIPVLGDGATVVVVVAGMIVTTFAGEVLALKLLSPAYVATRL